MDPNTLKRLIDEHANDDLSTAPDESDILDAALDLEQSFGHQGLVQRQSAVPLFSPELPRFERQGRDTTPTESNGKKGTTTERSIPTKERRTSAEVPDEEDSDSEVPRSPETPSGQKSRLVDVEDDNAGVKDSPSKTRQKSRVLEVSDDDEGDEEETKESLTSNKAGEKESDKGGEDDETKQESKEGVGNLISHIFGESGEESSGPEDFGTEASQKPRKRKDKDRQNSETAQPKKHRKQREESVGQESDVEDQKPEITSDFDTMMERRREMKRSSRRRKRRDEDIITANDDIAHQVIEEMKLVAEEDRELNEHGVAATKKLKMLPSVLTQLQKADLQMTLLESGVLPVFTEWLAPLPDKSLPHLQIREGLLKALQNFPPIDRDVLKSSCIGKAVMLLFRHPKETRQNKDRANKLINDWARPIFGLVANVKAISREEREQQDYSNLSKFRRRMSSSSDSVQRRKSIESALKDEQASASKPGDPGWCPRARVPQPSNRDYVVRPKWNIEQELMRTRQSGPDRYEKHARRIADKKSRNSVQRMRASSLSITGSKMGL